MIIMESNGNCKIEHSESTTRKQRTESSVFLLQPFSNSQQHSSRQETKYGTEGFINPVLINGILHKKAYTDYKYKNTNLPEKVLTDEFLIVHLFLLRFRSNQRPSNRRHDRFFLSSILNRNIFNSFFLNIFQLISDRSP